MVPQELWFIIAEQEIETGSLKLGAAGLGTYEAGYCTLHSESVCISRAAVQGIVFIERASHLSQQVKDCLLCSLQRSLKCGSTPQSEYIWQEYDICISWPNPLDSTSRLDLVLKGIRRSIDILPSMERSPNE